MRCFGIRHAILLFITVASGAPCAGLTREQIEAEWRRQDESRLTEIRGAGLVRFVEGEVRWPGVARDDRLRVPKTGAPTIDGRLAEACWKAAAGIPATAKDQPAFLLCCDGERLYVGVSLPADTETRYQGDPTAADAAGAVDGVKNGKYAFHTGHEPNPWWQVDLGSSQAVARIVVWNRLDYKPGLHNADHLLILTSDDGRRWTQRYDNQGKYFAGVGSETPPLEVALKPPVKARFVRLQVRSPHPIYFHLDEVEIFGTTDPKKNLALKRPARQSSLSQWSRGRGARGALFTVGRTRFGLAPGPAGVTANGTPLAAGQGAIHRGEGRTCVEVALPLGSAGGGFSAPGHTPTPLAVGGDWQVAWQPEGELGFGRNRLRLDLRAAKPLAPPVDLRVEAVVFTASRPERQIVLQAQHAKAASLPVAFGLGHEGAAAVIVTARQGAASFRDGRVFFIHPVQGTLRRAEKLLAEFGHSPPKALGELRQKAAALVAREKTHGPDPAAREALYRDARWLARQVGA